MSTGDPVPENRLAALAAEPSRWSDPLLDLLRTIADPYADAVVADHLAALEVTREQQAMHVGRLFQSLISTRDFSPPGISDPIDDYFASATLPSWADPQKIRMGEELFRKTGPLMMTLLYFKALPECYLCWRGAEVLVRTGRMTERTDGSTSLARRILETVQFVVDVMSPGGLAPGGPGMRAAQKVRLIHAAIRYFLREDARRFPEVKATPTGPHEGWDTATLGEPINQEDYLGTLMAFSASMIDGAVLLGARIGDDERNAYVHCWNVVGHLVGVRDEVLPRDYVDARRLMQRILARHSASSDAGWRLTSALLDYSVSLMPRELRGLPHQLIQHMLGIQSTAMLGVRMPTSPVAVIAETLLDAGFAELGRLEKRSPAVTKLVETASIELVGAIIKQFNGGKRVDFELPASLRGAWMTDGWTLPR